ncbi:MAG: YceI family protein [Deltaproteobacteria bacterium]|nr:YceI family protein [Deltaproteobacteria bacterium]
MKKLHLVGLSILFVFLAGQSAHSAARSWDLDKAHSNIYFSIEHIFSKVRGHFDDFKLEVNFEPQNLQESRFAFEIKVDSIDTNIGKRDKHLKSADFFDAGKYPLISFASEKITDAGNGVYEVAGKLTIKDQTYDLTLPLSLAGVKDHPSQKGKEVAGFNGEITIDRLAYKVGNGKFFDGGIIGKDVDVLVTLEVLSDK